MLIIYHTQTGNTKKMAEAVAEGVERIGDGFRMKRVSECIHTTRKPSNDALARCKALGAKVTEH